MTEIYKKVCREIWHDYCAQDLDFDTGIYVQDLFERMGLIRSEPYCVERHGDINSEWEFEEGDTIHLWNEDFEETPNA